MSDSQSNQPDLHKHENHEQAEIQAAASSAVPAQPPQHTGSEPTREASSPLSEVKPQKLLELLKNPSEALKLQPQKDWIYGAIGAAAGVVGFFFWIWFFQEAIRGKYDFFAGFGNLFRYSVMVLATPGKYLLLGVFSIALLVGTLGAVGNWQGARKRNWMEAVTFQGSTQLLFGAGWILSGVIAFLSLQLSMLLGVIILLISLLLLVSQATDLHEVSREKRFLFFVYSISIYLVLLFLAYVIIV
ncbi:hypothetical protein [Cohnella terricola]|uniref:Yip1 domain-containing protein n=1 Tax=Cohnella terricola TaxID=1289167 RepID=A0A559JDN4_9BACL|nr:hypothetical protein [Cohnella terricola]TVX97986.1 hypothetical protein FPZ45_17225 [Cohnella terricola]